MTKNLTIKILTVGKTKSKYWRAAEEDFTNRIARYASFEQVTVREAPQETLRNDDLVKKREADDILKKISSGEFITVLDRKGEQMTSEQLAKLFKQKAVSGKTTICFVVGGPLGLHEDVLKRADRALSFSKMTFPHELAKVMLLEQIYRAMTILRGEKYHK